jgi:hypothetical protein
MFSFEMHDGFYALGINPSDRDYFSVNVRGHLYQLAGLPMGWSLSPFSFFKLTIIFVNLLRGLDPKLYCPAQGNRTKTYLRGTRWHGARILPYDDDLLLFTAMQEKALTLRPHLYNLMDRLGLLHHPTKSFWAPAQVGHHLEIDINTSSRYFNAPEATLAKIAQP